MRRIRARVIGGSVALFLAVWMLITVVLVTGHDPALARKTATQAAVPATTTSATSTGGSGSSATTGSTSSGATSSSTGASSGSVSAATSSQS